MTREKAPFRGRIGVDYVRSEGGNTTEWNLTEILNDLWEDFVVEVLFLFQRDLLEERSGTYTWIRLGK